jgi:FkbM family methyltransferase
VRKLRDWLYATLLRIRPAQLAEFLKRALRVRRIYVRTDGFIFWVDPVSIFGQHLLSEGVHEAQMTRLLHAVLRPRDVFVDLGANEGYFSVLAARLVAGGRVYCIEPQSRLRPILLENFRINAASVALIPVAIADEQGEVDLFLRPSTNSGASSFFRHWRLGWARQRVQAMTLDSFFADNEIDRARLLKMDCEGAEPLIVQGGKSVLQEHRIDFLAVEFHGSITGVEKSVWTHRQLTDHGYILSSAGGQWVYHLPGLEADLTSLGPVNRNISWDP